MADVMIERLNKLSTAELADACLRLGVPIRCAPSEMQAVQDTMHCSGRVRPARHSGSVDIFLEALEYAEPGEVLVVDDGGRKDRSAIGDMIAREVIHAGLSGMTVSVETESGKLNSFRQAINDVIQQYEVALENHAAAVAAGTHTKAVPKIYTKTIATTSKSSGKLGKQKGEIYVVRGVVNKQTDNASTMTIYIEKTNLLYAGN